MTLHELMQQARLAKNDGGVFVEQERLYLLATKEGEGVKSPFDS